jgi:hypothetical protein
MKSISKLRLVIKIYTFGRRGTLLISVSCRLGRSSVDSLGPTARLAGPWLKHSISLYAPLPLSPPKMLALLIVFLIDLSYLSFSFRSHEYSERRNSGIRYSAIQALDSGHQTSAPVACSRLPVKKGAFDGQLGTGNPAQSGVGSAVWGLRSPV